MFLKMYLFFIFFFFFKFSFHADSNGLQSLIHSALSWSERDKVVKWKLDAHCCYATAPGRLHDSCGVTVFLSLTDVYQVENTKQCSSFRRHLVSLLDLHVLWVVLQAAYELWDWMALIADLIDCVKQWEPAGRRRRCSVHPYCCWLVRRRCQQCQVKLLRFSVALLFNLLVNKVFVLKDVIDLGCGGRALQLLTLQHLLLQLLDGLIHTQDKRNIQSNTVMFVPFDEVSKLLFWKKFGQEEKRFCKLITSPSPSLQKLLPLCGCGRRNTSWWDRPPHSSPGRWPRTRDLRCKRCGRRRSSPSDPTWSPQPWCCLRSPVRHRTLHRLRQCSEKQTKCERKFAWTTWWS